MKKDQKEALQEIRDKSLLIADEAIRNLRGRGGSSLAQFLSLGDMLFLKRAGIVWPGGRPYLDRDAKL